MTTRALARRVARIERSRPAPVGCVQCRGQMMWPVEDDPAARGPLACAFCGRRPTGTVKVIARSLWEAL